MLSKRGKKGGGRQGRFSLGKGGSSKVTQGPLKEIKNGIGLKPLKGRKSGKKGL